MLYKRFKSIHIQIRPKRFIQQSNGKMLLQSTKSFTLSFEPFASSGQAKESLAKKSRPLPYNCLKIALNGCKNLTPRPTEEHCRASSNRNSCYAIARNFFNGNYTKAGSFSELPDF